jgi:Protein of unknown function (DUF4236)
MAVRFSRSFKVAPGVRVRVNAKSTSVSLGGKGLRYTANSKGRRTTTASIRGTGLSVRHTSGTRRKTAAWPSTARSARPAAQPASPAARLSEARSASRSVPRPGVLAPRGEKELYKTIQTLHSGSSAMAVAARCERIAAAHPGQRIAALTLAGLLAMSHDRDMAIRNLGPVLASGAEVADDQLLRRYSPVRSLSIRAVEPAATVPLSRDLVAMLLVQLHMAAGQLDWAQSAAAQVKDTTVANAMRLQLAIRYQQNRPGQPPQ